MTMSCIWVKILCHFGYFIDGKISHFYLKTQNEFCNCCLLESISAGEDELNNPTFS